MSATFFEARYLLSLCNVSSAIMIGSILGLVNVLAASFSRSFFLLDAVAVVVVVVKVVTLLDNKDFN